ncbi:MAG: MATE family efflux transporter [Bacteroidales bacterium]
MKAFNKAIHHRIDSISHFSKETKDLLKLAIPIIGSSLLILTYNLVDMLWIGRLGANAIASVGIAAFYLAFSASIANFYTIGLNVKVSQAIGKEDRHAIRLYSSAALVIVFGIAFFYTLYFSLFAAESVDFFGIRNEQVRYDAILYLRINVMGSVLGFSLMYMVNLFNAHDLTKETFLCSSVGVILNIILDPIFIFTLGLGVKGAAFTTVLGKTVSLLCFIYLVKKKKKIRMGKFQFSLPHFKEILWSGTPVALNRFLFVFIYVYLVRVVSEFGVVSIAVFRVVNQMEAIMVMFFTGIKQSLSITVGHAYGAFDFLRLRTLYKKGMKLGLIVGICGSFVFAIFPEFLIGLFFSDSKHIEGGVYFLRIISLSQVFIGLGMICTGVYNGIGRTDVPAFFSVLINSVRVPVAFFLSHFTLLAVDGVWWTICGAAIVRGAVLVIISFVSLRYLIEDPNIDYTKGVASCKISSKSVI